MLNINLFPGPKRRKFFKARTPKVEFSFPSKDRAAILSFGLIGLILVVGIVSYVMNKSAINQLDEKIEVAVADSIRYAESIRLINDIKEREEWIRGRIDIISRVDQHRYLWPKLMAGINDALPPVTWLIRIETMTPYPALVFRIEGISFSNIEVANFMRRLARLQQIDDVRLLSSKEHSIDGYSTMAFTLECHYERGASGELVQDSGQGQKQK